MALDSLVLSVVFVAVFFYILYGIIRAAVRDGILQADERRQKARQTVGGGGHEM
ncbi:MULTISPECIES: hypothetical protein [Micrococcaceae]|uniref:hypothetical protein n=1 Tax=Micrococcaceae TaxID=1268 RepID=UPI00037CFF51|nr:MULTISPECIES: hypothetical protein [Micrococcaceae]